MSSTVFRKFDNKDAAKPEIWAAKVCPFAERSIIALEEMGIDYDRVEIDLKNKPASLYDISPKGLVPALKDQGKVITDSYNIIQYIGEMWDKSDDSNIQPKQPYDRAIARQWCEYISTNVVKTFFEMLLKPSEEERDAAKKKLSDSIKAINDAMKDISAGPYFMGAHFTVVDIMLITMVERFIALERYRQFTIPQTPEFERFHSWWSTVQQKASFQKARCGDEMIYDAFSKYASGEAETPLAKAIKKGEAMP